MSALSVTVKEDITNFTIVGGTDLVFTPDGEEIASGIHLIAASVADFFSRPTLTIRTRQPRSVNGVITKGKRWYNMSFPRLDANGVLYYDVFRGEVETHPATSAADQLSMDHMIANLMFCSALTSFRATGSLA